MAIVSFNKINIQNRLNKSLKQTSYQNLAFRNAETRFNRAKNNAIEDFDNHIVTQELLNENGVSSILPKGNLFSFLGFTKGYKPIAKLKVALFSPSRIRIYKRPRFTYNGKVLGYEFKVISPSVNDIYNETMGASGISEWTSTSWVELIEEGIPNFASYLYSKTLFGKNRISRSRQAIQRKDGSSGGEFKMDYITGILNKFLSYFSRR